MSLMWASKAGSVAAVGDMRVGGLYLTQGIWLHSSGMLPRICTNALTTADLLPSRCLTSTICSVSTKLATVPCVPPGPTSEMAQGCADMPAAVCKSASAP